MIRDDNEDDVDHGGIRFRGNATAQQTPNGDTVDGDPPSPRDKRPRSRLSLFCSACFDYFSNETCGGSSIESHQEKLTAHRDRIYTFVSVPFAFEKFVSWSWLLCLDVFLHAFTLLPVRLGLLAFTYLHKRLNSAQACDLTKVVVIVVSVFVLSYLDISMLYHVIRGQSTIKLYIFFNMLDIGDKLLSSIGQDIADSLYLSVSEKRSLKKRHQIGLIVPIFFCCVYTILHTSLMALQVVTLNVAFNSHAKSLLTIMMSNNFVEIKGNVFRKFGKNNLFQIACADGRERFHLMLLLSMVAIRNLAQYAWNPEHLETLLPDMAGVLFAELIVDWVKHAFIAKFNELPSSMYADFSLRLAKDVLSSWHQVNDRVELVSARMGFSTLPSVCIALLVVLQAPGPHRILPLGLIFSCLLVLKILVGMTVHALATKISDSSSNTASTDLASSSSPLPPMASVPQTKEIPVPLRETHSDDDLSQTPKFSRSRVFGSFSSKDDLFDQRVPSEPIMFSSQLAAATDGAPSSFGAKGLAPSNPSTTSLVSLHKHHILQHTLSEDYDNDLGAGVIEDNTASATNLPANDNDTSNNSRNRTTSESTVESTAFGIDTAEQLSDVDRFTMVGNRIS